MKGASDTIVSSRNRYFDFIRGIAIIMVIGIHTFRPMSVHEYNIAGVIDIIIRQTLNCAVPLFLAISGYFISGKSLCLNKLKKRWCSRQIRKVYIPTLIFSIPFLIQALAFSHSITAIIYNLSTFLICGYGVFYFIAVIIQFYILTPILTKYNSKKMLAISALISTISILYVTYILQILNPTLPLIFYAGPCTLWIVFYCLGIYIRKCNRCYSLNIAILIMIVGLILSIIECYLWAQISYPAYGIKLSAFLYSVGIILVLFSKITENAFTETMLTKSIISIGNISFGIYLIHLLFINILNINQYDYWILRCSIILLLSIMSIRFLYWLVPFKYHNIFGLV